MRFLFLLSTFLLCISASSQSPTMAGMAANMQQTINIPLSSNSSPLMIHEFNKFFGDATNGNCLWQIKLKD